MSLLFTLLDAAQTKAAASKPVSSWKTFAPLIAIAILFYFLLMRPQQRKEKALRDLRRSVQPGDVVITSGGIRGTVKSVKPDEGLVKVSIAPNVEIVIVQDAISSVPSREAAARQSQAQNGGGSFGFGRKNASSQKTSASSNTQSTSEEHKDDAPSSEE